MNPQASSRRQIFSNGTSAALGLILVTAAFFAASPAEAGAVKDFTRAGVLIGADDDNQDNPLVQPADSDINQTLDNGDVLEGQDGPDVIIGLRGADVLIGGGDDDILIGGPDGGAPNSDFILGGSGNDINIWAPGDGSDAFIGGEGDYDVMIFGVLDRDENRVPILSPSDVRRRTGIPTANVSGQGGFCVLEQVERATTGYDFLVRFFTFSDGLLKLTVRLREVEQLFCTSAGGGAIAYADLTVPEPTLRVVSAGEIEDLNRVVARIVR